jgi:hypothetical protein
MGVERVLSFLSGSDGDSLPESAPGSLSESATIDYGSAMQNALVVLLLLLLAVFLRNVYVNWRRTRWLARMVETALTDQITDVPDVVAPVIGDDGELVAAPPLDRVAVPEDTDQLGELLHLNDDSPGTQAPPAQSF